MNHRQWSEQLLNHHRAGVEQYPQHELAVVFDIDGTLVDPRATLLSLLKQYDRCNGTQLFIDKTLQCITHYENHLEQQLDAWALPQHLIQDVCDYYFGNRWDEATVLDSQTAYAGVEALLAQLYAMPNTAIFFCTGRSEQVRALTLRGLNQLCQPLGVEVDDERLLMNPHNWQRVAEAKHESVKQLECSGYRVTAFIDNEPANLNALADMPDHTLLIHVDTHFAEFQPLPERCLCQPH